MADAFNYSEVVASGPIAYRSAFLPHQRRRVKVRWVTPLGEETASMS
jgi:hypothetical protein